MHGFTTVPLLIHITIPALNSPVCQHALSSYHEGVSVGRQQSRPVPAAQSAHGAVVRMCRPDEVVHVPVPAGHTRRRPHRVAPQYVDGIVQALQTVLDTTLLQRDGTQREM